MEDKTMKKLTANDPETHSVDVRVENLEQLRRIFPETFPEGKIDFDVLKQLLGGSIDDRDEKYGLNWHGKRRARQIALTPSAGTLRPCPENSVDWDTTQNLMIEGDNLEVLKLLQKSYASKVKLIYIDPPYNTGKDFVYRDNFQDSIKHYLELTGQVEGGARITSNTEASGRFHTDWLNMMYPRLRLSRDLLSDDGVLIVSIDENEHANLMAVLTSIFGEENFCGEIVWKNSSKNDQDYVSVQHEYFLFFAKNKAVNGGRWRERKEGLDEIYKTFAALREKYDSDWEAIHAAALDWFGQFSESNPISESKHYNWMDERGVYFASDISGPNFGQYRYELPHPVTRQPCKEPASGWRYPPETMKQRVKDGLVHFGPDHTTIPKNKTYLKDTEFQSLTSMKVRDGRAASKRLETLFGIRVFTNPKDELLLRDLMKSLNVTGSDIVVDFFAGSGTTFHSVLTLNRDQGSRCRAVLVQYPEDLRAMRESAAGSAKATAENAIQYLESRGRRPVVSELAIERLRLVGLKAKESTVAAEDVGFRVFKLDSSNIRAWEPDRGDLERTLLSSVEHLMAGRAEADVLYELLLKLGLDLCVPIETRAIATKDVHSVGGGILMACLTERIELADVEGLALGIVDWQKALAPAGGTTCVFRDSAFMNDIAKTNMAAILEQYGIANVRSL
jgi:adenine-specific DNA-methyltransferase